MGHDVFLSYSRQDKETMQRLRDSLRDAGITVWTDDNLKVGTPAWETAIQDAIENANCVVVLLSPDSKKSKWVGREIAYAENFKITILPVLISDKEKESIPIRLIDYQYASLVGVNFKQFVKDLAAAISPIPASAAPPAAPPEIQPPPTPAASPNLFSGTPPLRRSAQSPFASGVPNLRQGAVGRPGVYQDFLQRYQFNSAEWEKLRTQERVEAEAKRKKELAEARTKLENIREELPDAPAIRPWHPVDQLRLAWWLLTDPNQAYIFQYKAPLEMRVRAGAWLLSLIIYLPLLILALAATIGWLPVEDDLLGLPRVILPVAVVVFWALTGLFAAYTDDSGFQLTLVGSGVGLILIAPLIGGWQFMIAALLVSIIVVMAILWSSDLEETRASLLLVGGVSALGIAGKMLHVDLLEHTLPLVGMGLPASLLLLAALCTIAGLWGAAVGSPVFRSMAGEEKEGGPFFFHTPSLEENGLTTWQAGLGLAVIVCVTLEVGCDVAVKTNADVTGWIADRLPDKISGISPDIAFTVAGVDVSFSLADVTHGLAAGWTAVMVAVIAFGILMPIALIPALIGEQAFDKAVVKRRRSAYGPLIAGLYVAACLILLIVPPLAG